MRAIYFTYICHTGNDLDSAGPSVNINLAEVFEKSIEFQSLKQHLDIQVEVALKETQTLSPEFTTSFFWQVKTCVQVFVCM